MTLTFNSDLFNRRMRELGYTTESERAAAIGTSRSGLDRLRKRPSLSHQRALEIASVIGVDVDALFVRVRRAA